MKRYLWEEELSREFYLGCVEGEVTEEATLLLNEERPATDRRKEGVRTRAEATLDTGHRQGVKRVCVCVSV